MKLSPSTPSNEIIQIRSIGEKMQLKLITYEDAVTEAGGNPDEVKSSWLLHDIQQSPEMMDQLKTAVFQKLGTIQAKQMNAAGTPSVAEMAGLQPGAPGPARSAHEHARYTRYAPERQSRGYARPTRADAWPRAPHRTTPSRRRRSRRYAPWRNSGWSRRSVPAAE